MASNSFQFSRSFTLSVITNDLYEIIPEVLFPRGKRPGYWSEEKGKNILPLTIEDLSMKDIKIEQEHNISSMLVSTSGELKYFWERVIPDEENQVLSSSLKLE